MLLSDVFSRDRERIEELHRVDMQASKARDVRALRSLLTDDAVVLPPGGRMVRGREALDRDIAALEAAKPASDILEYRFDWQELRVLGEYVFEWGFLHGRERDRASGRETSTVYQLMRILQRQPDGAWKVHRTIWNEPAAGAPAAD